MHVLKDDQVVYAFEPTMEPKLVVDPASTVVFECRDCYGGQITGEDDDPSRIDRSLLNPATGPVGIRGARPGDLLLVDLLAIDLAGRGLVTALPGKGLLAASIQDKAVRLVPIAGGRADYLGLSLPVKAMVGVLGVAPASSDGSCPTHTPGRHGGNLDTRDIGPGSRLYLPIRQAGALFALGDCHALMGDGEVCLSGLEVAARVTARLDLVRKTPLDWPLLETADESMFLVSAKRVEDAARLGVDLASRALARAFDLKREDACMLTSLMVDVRISQLVNPAVTVRIAIPKPLVGTDRLLWAVRSMDHATSD